MEYCTQPKIQAASALGTLPQPVTHPQPFAGWAGADSKNTFPPGWDPLLQTPPARSTSPTWLEGKHTGNFVQGLLPSNAAAKPVQRLLFDLLAGNRNVHETKRLFFFPCSPLRFALHMFDPIIKHTKKIALFE